MLHIAFPELPACRKQYLLACEIRLDIEQGQDILQLIAEAKRSAGLVES